MAKTIVLTEVDRARLSQVLDVNHSSGDDNMSQCIRRLNGDLENAKIVDADKVPENVITMNTKVVLRDLASGEDEEWMLCFPNQADIFENRLSVLAPMGVAMLGTSTGDVIEWATPSGTAKAEIKNISYQPEAAGDFHL